MWNAVMKKILVSIVGGGLVFIGLLLIVLPGPAWLFLPIGLAVLSLEYPSAKKWLKKAQRNMSDSAQWLDRKIAERRRRRHNGAH